jgi:hypothetical protein
MVCKMVNKEDALELERITFCEMWLARKKMIVA